MIFLLALLSLPLSSFAGEPAFPSLDVLKVARISTSVTRDLAEARSAYSGGNIGRACRFLGRVESGEGYLRSALGAIDTLFNGHMMSGQVPPAWLEDLELAAMSARPIRELAQEAAQACDLSSPKPEPMEHLARELESFDKTWAPFRERAIRALMPD